MSNLQKIHSFNVFIHIVYFFLLQNVYSSGKTLECIVMGMLYDKGLFKFEDKISKHWPEFGQNEKEDLQICDVLRHESGLSYFTESLPTIKGHSMSILNNF